MAKTYSLIQAQTLTSTAATVTFSNIPQNFTDLILKVSSRTTGTAPNILLSINGSDSTFSNMALYGDGANPSATSGVPRVVSYSSFSTDTANTFGNTDVYIPNYAGSANKIFSTDTVSENNGTTAYIGMFSGLWATTSAITSITLTPSSGSFAQNATFYLYGIGAHRASGGTITSDANFTYHTFTSSGTFTALEKINGAEVLMVAGGGGGGGGTDGGSGAAGGGAGGVVNGRIPTLIAGTSYSAIVGAGGNGGTSGGNGGTGGDSLFSSITVAKGGGFGAASTGNGNASAGGNGGSGGGAAHWNNNGTTAGGLGTAGQGNNGGSAIGAGGGRTGGGGGGAGAVGTSGSTTGTSSTGQGGIGTSNYTSWHQATNTGVNSSGVYYIAGGAGGAGDSAGNFGFGGIGGGANGRAYNNSGSKTADAGTTNTGGGGGGCIILSGTGPAVGGAGGSGLVIIRYPNVE